MSVLDEAMRNMNTEDPGVLRMVIDDLIADGQRKDAEIARLRETLKQALRQWKMYSEFAERGDDLNGFNLADEKSLEGDMYRAAYALAHEQLQIGD